MALTITVDTTMGLGGKAFRFVTITHDETTSTFTAGSVDLAYIEFVGLMGTYYTSTTASAAVDIALSIVGDGTIIDLLFPVKAGSKSKIMLIGW